MSRISLCILIIGSVFSSTFGLIDVVVQDLGCWKEVPEESVLPSWEGKDILLDGPHEIRVEALQKCAKVAQKNGFKIFALREGGLCATGPLESRNFTKNGKSLECDTSGRGGMGANQVYFVNTLIDAKYIPLGCWKHTIEEMKPLEGQFVRLMDDWKVREDPEKKCARAAASIGHHVFGLHDDGACYSSNISVENLTWIPRSSDCGPLKQGGEESIYLYHLTLLSNVTLVNMGCWETDVNDPVMPLVESKSPNLGEHEYKIRKDAVEKCAIYNADKKGDLDIIGIVDGGACASVLTESIDYKELGESNECEPDGKGSTNANQVYKLINVVKNITVIPTEPFEPLLVNSLGCWKDGPTPLLQTLEGSDLTLFEEPLSRENPVQACAKVAYKRGYEVFALKEGKCYSSKIARSLFKILGPSEECVDETGGIDSLAVYEIGIVRDPWISNEGCFEYHAEGLVPLEGVMPPLEDNPKRRLNPIKKCSYVASALNFTHFALLDGGLCHGFYPEMLEKCIPSAACASNGKGSRSAVQIYKIKEINNFTLENLGCWKDDAFHMIPLAEGATEELSGQYARREDAIGACARYARSRGFKVFALRAGGMCLTSENAEDNYNWYGSCNKCAEDGKGGAWSNQVYRINEDWWQSPVDWWKVPEPWNKLGAWNCTWSWHKTPTAPWM